jgi:hypothetical protein
MSQVRRRVEFSGFVPECNGIYGRHTKGSRFIGSYSRERTCFCISSTPEKLFGSRRVPMLHCLVCLCSEDLAFVM